METNFYISILEGSLFYAGVSKSHHIAVHVHSRESERLNNKILAITGTSGQRALRPATPCLPQRNLCTYTLLPSACGEAAGQSPGSWYPCPPSLLVRPWGFSSGSTGLAVVFLHCSGDGSKRGQWGLRETSGWEEKPSASSLWFPLFCLLSPSSAPSQKTLFRFLSGSFHVHFAIHQSLSDFFLWNV